MVSSIHGESGFRTLAAQGAKVQTSEKKLITVKRGETLYELANKHGVTVSEIAQLNGITNPHMIREGQELWVMAPKSMEKSTETNVSKDNNYDFYVNNNDKDNDNQILVSFKYGNLFFLDQILGPMLEMFQEHKSLPKASVAMNEVEGTDQHHEGYTILLEPYEANSVKIEKEEPVEEKAISRFSNEEIELLARVIYGEARGESFEGQVAVGAVVLNRLEDPRFPNTLEGVIYQKGAFTAVSDKQIHLTPNDQAFQAAEAAIEGMDPTGGAIYYYNPHIATDRWIKTRPVIKQIGNHTFSI